LEGLRSSGHELVHALLFFINSRLPVLQLGRETIGEMPLDKLGLLDVDGSAFAELGDRFGECCWSATFPESKSGYTLERITGFVDYTSARSEKTKRLHTLESGLISVLTTLAHSMMLERTSSNTTNSLGLLESLTI
jgi:hypothetical protein